MIPSQVQTNGHTNFMNEFFLGYQEFVTSLINDNCALWLISWIKIWMNLFTKSDDPMTKKSRNFISLNKCHYKGLVYTRCINKTIFQKLLPYLMSIWSIFTSPLFTWRGFMWDSLPMYFTRLWDLKGFFFQKGARN